ncbi:MAG: hypothetical protein M1818_003026 [Claussenomyces sp. TS43310]|nr:MAG: hypothetical protein M1818_003026 [Claussenomyces sp. TS43310]
MFNERYVDDRYYDIESDHVKFEKSSLQFDFEQPQLPIFDTLSLSPQYKMSSRRRYSMFRNRLVALLPSFITKPTSGGTSMATKITPTTYLNGLRGVAAFFVFCHHYLMEYYRDITFYAYGTRSEDNYLIQLPFISLIHSGSFMVAIFFILSGYVLSYKTVHLIYKSNGTGIHDQTIFQTLASSAFRRAPRLYIPLIIPWILTTLIVYSGYFTRLDYEIGPPCIIVMPAPTLFDQFSLEWANFKDYTNLFVWERMYPTHLSQLWTIPVEFRGSLIVFLLLLCFAKVKHGVRLVLEFSISWYALSYDRWDIFLFVWGIIFSELSAIRTIATNSTYGIDLWLNKDQTMLRLLRYGMKMLWVTLFLLGAWMGSFPIHEDDGGDVSPFFHPLIDLTPSTPLAELESHRFWATIGAVFFMLGMDHLEILQKPFTTSLAQYLGDISYGFYVVHWTILRSIGRFIPVLFIALMENRFHGFCTAFVFELVLTVWLGDIQMRIGDRPAVKIARWLEKSCMQRPRS